MNLPKVLSIVLAAAVLANFVLFVTKAVTAELFWLVIVIAAVTAYLILPKIKRKL